jgi:hypothetical protein
MNEIVIEGVDDLYHKMGGKDIDPVKHGPMATFHAKMSIIKDPNACSCKKGRAAHEAVLKMYMSMPAVIRMDPLRTAAKELLGEGTLVFKVNGIEFAKVG